MNPTEIRTRFFDFSFRAANHHTTRTFTHITNISFNNQNLIGIIIINYYYYYYNYFYLLPHSFSFSVGDFVQWVFLPSVVWPQTEPSIADSWSDRILGFIPIFLTLVFTFSCPDPNAPMITGTFWQANNSVYFLNFSISLTVILWSPGTGTSMRRHFLVFLSFFVFFFVFFSDGVTWFRGIKDAVCLDIEIP